MVEYNRLLMKRFAEISKSGMLFRVAVTGDDIWKIYLRAFQEGNDPIFRDPKSTTHSCNHCKNFIRRYANVVGINDDNEIVTMFDVADQADDEYRLPTKAIAETIKRSKIIDVFFETFDSLKELPYESVKKTADVFRLGVAVNRKIYNAAEAERYGVVEEGEIRTFNHFHLDLDRQYVDLTGASLESIIAKFRDDKQVFQTGLDDISLETLELVRDLIVQGSLLNGDAHLHKIEKMIPLKKEYDLLKKGKKDNWCWKKSFKFPFARFKNELIGVLCYELAGSDLNIACEKWNRRVDPANYMKASAPITKKQIEDAARFVEENGYTESFNRRHATIDDVRVSRIRRIRQIIRQRQRIDAAGQHQSSGDGKIRFGEVFFGV